MEIAGGKAVEGTAGHAGGSAVIRTRKAKCEEQEG